MRVCDISVIQLDDSEIGEYARHTSGTEGTVNVGNPFAAVAKPPWDPHITLPPLPFSSSNIAFARRISAEPLLLEKRSTKSFMSVTVLEQGGRGKSEEEGEIWVERESGTYICTHKEVTRP